MRFVPALLLFSVFHSTCLLVSWRILPLMQDPALVLAAFHALNLSDRKDPNKVSGT